MESTGRRLGDGLGDRGLRVGVRNRTVSGGTDRLIVLGRTVGTVATGSGDSGGDVITGRGEGGERQNQGQAENKALHRFLIFVSGEPLRQPLDSHTQLHAVVARRRRDSFRRVALRAA